mmetsp:Transcript_62955/g.153304  ORF Transcript_62955/g.153304 Transcript_62955/m.153304 type:complete len:986 (-) Transcript_62955:93-3050(-)
MDIPPSLPPLWSDNDVEIRDDGYLILKQDSKAYKKHVLRRCRDGTSGEGEGGVDADKRPINENEDQHQPLMLHSTLKLLKALHPKIKIVDDNNSGRGTIDEILRQPGYINYNTSNGSKNDEDSTVVSIDHLVQDVEENLIINAVETNDQEDQIISDDDQKQERKKKEEEEVSTSKTMNARRLKYRRYQHLVMGDNIPNGIQSALLDIECFRHRTLDVEVQGGGEQGEIGGGNRKKKKTKKERRLERAKRKEMGKVGALAEQQKRLLKMQSSSSSATPKEGNNDVGSPHEKNFEEEDEDDEDSEDDDDEEDMFDMQRSESYMLVRLVRTINSIRALFPFLLGMFNHPLRNDKDLVIGKAKYDTKKRNSSCWLISTQVFAKTTNKNCMTCNTVVYKILDLHLGVEYATSLFKDWKCSSDHLWSSKWIQQIQKRSCPPLLHPLEILLQQKGVDGEQKTEQEKKILLQAHALDEVIAARQQVDLDCGPDTQRHYDRTVRQLHQRLEKILKSRFKGAHINLYGSCLSNLSLGKGSDVDLSLWIPEADRIKRGFREGRITANKYEREMKRLVYNVYHRLDDMHMEFTNMQAIARARIPVIKGTWINAGNPYRDDGSIDFDICFLNDIAVANSSLLGEYTKVDPRVRTFLIGIKQFAQERKINSAKDGFVSSYAWVNLAIFYLQCIGFVPNLQSQALMDEVGFVKNPYEYWHYVNSLDTTFVEWYAAKNVWTMPTEYETTPVSILIYGFFEFYSSRFPSGMFAVSMKQGRPVLPKLSAIKLTSFLCIEDPFETFDCHTPHDLSAPVDEKGAPAIMDFIEEAEDHIENILCSDVGFIDSIDIWPPSPYKEFANPQPKSTQKKANTSKPHHSPAQKKTPNKANNDSGKTAENKASTPSSKNRKGRRNGQKKGTAENANEGTATEKKGGRTTTEESPQKQARNDTETPSKRGRGSGRGHGRRRGGGRGGRSPGGRGRGRGGGRGGGGRGEKGSNN